MTKEDEEDYFLMENSESGRNFNTLRADNELFNEEESKIVYTAVSAKRVRLPRNGEDWEILVNGKVALKLKGTRFTNSEKDFLRTVDGMQLLISEYKDGRKSVVKIKETLKKAMKVVK